MEPLIHRFHELFAQLGLPNGTQDIERFIQTHAPLPMHVPLPEAPFWTPAQASFLREALQADADWVELVEQLDAALRAKPAAAQGA
jgi:hypothetical protein